MIKAYHPSTRSDQIRGTSVDSSSDSGSSDTELNELLHGLEDEFGRMSLLVECKYFTIMNFVKLLRF